MIKIIGAGLAGLLAANMMRRSSPTIFEAQPSLPNNHSAVLRFRTSAIGDVLNIPFKKVTMIKDHLPWKNPVADALAYSFKNSGTYRSDRSITSGKTVADRWIAPPDLIAKMASDQNITFGSKFDLPNIDWAFPIISTVPMPALMRLLDYREFDPSSFGYMPGLNVRATIQDCDAYISLLVPDPEIPFSRISITGNEMIVEASGKGEAITQVDLFGKLILSAATNLLGISSSSLTNIIVKKMQYAKIAPIDDAARKAFMHWATDKFNIYSLGRFATWRPGLLLDDLIQDVRLIDRWIQQGKYSVARHR